MKSILLFILLLAGSSKDDNYSMPQMAGKYLFKGKDYDIRLTLRKDSICDYYAGNGEMGVLCDGRWRITNNDSLEILCDGKIPQTDQEAVENALAGLIPGQKRYFKIINRRKLMEGKDLLKKR